MIYKNEEINSINVDESHIVSINWIGEQGSDLEMIIDWCGQENLMSQFDFNNIKTKMVFSFCYEIDFCFKYKNPYTIGLIEITKFSISKIEDGNYSVEFIFDFQPVGYIKFYCAELFFLIQNNK